jgi:tetratricopeptide (TPR) repeat protein
MASMKYLLLALPLFLISCSDADNRTPEQLRLDVLNSIAEKEKALAQPGKLTPDTARVDELVKLMISFVRNNPEDSKTPEILFKAGELSVSIGQFDGALNILQRVYSDYPEFEKAVEAYFLMAFVLENYIGDKARAEEFYKKIIEKHPRHDMALQAGAALNLMNLTDEELIRKFESQNTPTP